MASEEAKKLAQELWTPNGFDPRWVELINGALADREVEIRITDLSPRMWDEYIGPLLDAIENGELP